MALFTGHTITPDSALGGVKIERSVRFNKTDSAYFQRTVSSTGNQKVWTWSAWFKRTRLHDNGGTSYLFSCNNVSGNNGIAGLYIQSDQIYTYFDTTGTNPYGAVSSRKFRDMNSWYHIVWQVDAITEVQKIWINGVELSLDSGLNPPNYAYGMNQSGIKMFMGRDGDWGGDASNMYLTEAHYSDGTKYQASDFGYTDAQTGQWRPKNGNVIKSNITYGTNGFWLDFRDNTSTTTLGYDYSGNGNHFTATNISVSSGYGNDSLEDTPTNNACMMNDLDQHNATITNGGLQMTQASDPCRARGTHVMPPNTGKYYYEMEVQTGASYIFGMKSTLRLGSSTSGNEGRYGYYGQSGNKQDSSSSSSYGASYTAGDTVAILYDSDSGEVYFYKNNTSQGLAFTDVNTTDYQPFVYLDNYGTTPIVHFNFGQRPFKYTPPTGAKGLGGKYNVNPVSAGVVKPQRFFDIVLYTGNGSTGQSITSLEFQPDLVWCKTTSDNRNHVVTDSVRGRAKGLYPDADNTEFTDDAGKGLVSFDVNGFTVGEPQNASSHNKNGETIVAWCWKAGGAAVSNSDGDISSSVSVNEEAGFSIVSYTGDGNVNSTVGHGLNGNPDFIIIKNRDAQWWWRVYHSYYGTTATQGLFLNETNASYTHDEHGGIKAITSTTFGFGTNGTNTLSGVNKSADKYIAYCWKEIPGFSKFGSYIGNGNSAGAFVHCGFRPAWVVIKKTSGTSNWNQRDTARDPDNPTGEYLLFNSNEASLTSSSKWDILSNGFKHYNTSGAFNESGGTYTFVAYAEEPNETMFGLDANAR